MLKNGFRHSNIELQCARRRTNVVEHKGKNNKSVTESFKSPFSSTTLVPTSTLYFNMGLSESVLKHIKLKKVRI